MTLSTGSNEEETRYLSGEIIRFDISSIAYKLNDKFQVGLQKGHCMKIVLVKVINDLRSSSDEKNISVLILLDLTATFKILHHNIHLDLLEN